MRIQEKKVKTLWKKVTDSSPAYNKLCGEDKKSEDEKKAKLKTECKQQESKNKVKLESKVTEAKSEKKKRKGWKRLRHAALMTCRYIGIGVTHMSPISTYPASGYTNDPYGWAGPYNAKMAKSQPPHWTTGIILNGW